MSGTTGTQPVSQPGGREGPAPPAGQEQGATLGLTSATGLVTGIIIGRPDGAGAPGRQGRPDRGARGCGAPVNDHAGGRAHPRIARTAVRRRPAAPGNGIRAERAGFHAPLLVIAPSGGPDGPGSAAR